MFSSIRKWLMFFRPLIRVTFHRFLLNLAFHSDAFHRLFHEWFPVSRSRRVHLYSIAVTVQTLFLIVSQLPPPIHLHCSFLYTKSPPGSSLASHFNGVIAVYFLVHGTWQRSARHVSNAPLSFPRDPFVTNKQFSFFKTQKPFCMRSFRPWLVNSFLLNRISFTTVYKSLTVVLIIREFSNIGFCADIILVNPQKYILNNKIDGPRES